MPDSPVTVVITYHTQPGKAPEASAALAAVIATVQNLEPDCLGITMLQDPADDTRLLLYESWTSQAAYDGPHRDTPHLKAFIENAGALFAGPPVITYWQEIQSP